MSASTLIMFPYRNIPTAYLRSSGLYKAIILKNDFSWALDDYMMSVANALAARHVTMINQQSQRCLVRAYIKGKCNTRTHCSQSESGHICGHCPSNDLHCYMNGFFFHRHLLMAWPKCLFQSHHITVTIVELPERSQLWINKWHDACSQGMKASTGQPSHTLTFVLL